MSTTADLSPPVNAESTTDIALGDGVPPPRRSWSVAPLLLRLHFYGGVLIAPFLVVSALTGLGFVFTPQLSVGPFAQGRPGRVQGPADVFRWRGGPLDR